MTIICILLPYFIPILSILGSCIQYLALGSQFSISSILLPFQQLTRFAYRFSSRTSGNCDFEMLKYWVIGFVSINACKG